MATNKSVQLGVRFTVEQKELLEKVASEAGMNMSEYVRVLVLKALGIIK